MKNNLTDMLNISYPIIQGGMMNISFAPLVSAVSNAGGLGTLGYINNISRWHDEIKRIKEITGKPFAVNIPLYISDINKRLQIICDEEIEVLITAAGKPSIVTDKLKNSGIKILHVVSNSVQAVKAESAGVDAVIAEGGESGGMVAGDIVSNMVLIPRIVDSVKIPVIAAGGIFDARGFIACLAFGAQGIQMGTVFEASIESGAPKEWKDGIIKSSEVDTMVFTAGDHHVRMLKPDRYPGNIITGQVSALVTKIEKAEEIMNNIKANIEPVFRRIEQQIQIH
jgi:enoyl-[acyl-carrier protein] reductase II